MAAESTKNSGMEMFFVQVTDEISRTWMVSSFTVRRRKKKALCIYFASLSEEKIGFRITHLQEEKLEIFSSNNDSVLKETKDGYAGELFVHIYPTHKGFPPEQVVTIQHRFGGITTD